MKRRGTVIILAAWLFLGLAAAPAPAVAAEGAAQPWETPSAEALSSPFAAPAKRIIRYAVKRLSPPPPPNPESMPALEASRTPSTPPVFDEKLLLRPTPPTPPAPYFPGYSSDAEPAVPAPPPGLVASSVVLAPQLDSGEWRLNADRIVGRNDSRYVEAMGRAVIVKGTDSLRADYMRYYKLSRWIVLKGHVRVIWEGDLIEAEEAEFDLANHVGWLKRGKIFEGKAHVYVRTDYARKYAASSYRAQNATITRCDGPSPAWDMRAKTADIALDGRTRLWNAVADVKGVPVAYLPYMLLPGGASRQSGLLPPDISQSNSRGFSVDLPYYWAIDKEHDMTFYEYAMSDRGLMQGVEYRHTDNPETKGDWRFDYLNDRKTAKTLGAEEKYVIDDLLRPNSNRWWLRGKFNGFFLDPAWNLKIDVDFVSDQNYLREFSSGLSGYEKSRKNFLDEFGRDIDVADSLTRKNTAFVSRSWDRFGFAGKLGWTENLAYRNGNNSGSKDPTTQTLPELNFFIFKDRVPGTPLDFEATSQFDYFWRESGTRGVRTDVHPTVSLPLPLGPFTFIPSVGLRNTAYSVGGYSNEPSSTTTNKTPARTMYEAGFSGFTELSRVYPLEDAKLEATSENVGKSRWGAIRHSITPRVAFEYVPAPQSQDRLPYFDSLDRITRKNLITYSLTNVLDRRRTSIEAQGNPGATVPTAVDDYIDFLNVRVLQSYDRDEADRTDELDRYPRRPFSDIMLEATVRPEKYISLTSRTFYSPYLGRPTEHENQLTLSKETLGRLRFDYDYLYPLNEYTRQRSNDVQVVGIGVDYQVTEKLKVSADYRMDIAAHSDLEKTVGLEWKDQCYDVELRVSRKPSDTSVELLFNLLDFNKP